MPTQTEEHVTSSNRLTNRHVVVVGGGSGMGLATARAAALAGATVTILGRTEAGVVRAVEQLPPGASGRAVSSLDRAKLGEVFDDIGPFDHLVYTAGDKPVSGPITTLAVDDVRRAFETRYFGALTTVDCAIAHLDKRGSITLTSGAAGVRPRSASGALASVCGAMEGLTRALAVELSPVRVNLVRPGFTRTEMWDDLDEDVRESLFAQTAGTNLVGHAGEACEVAQAYLYCMTQTYASGSIVTVDGGYSLV
jgi:NAD(P)-dependent dehydrogenase (short-subunit alcohol dehydrogenase family)